MRREIAVVFFGQLAALLALSIVQWHLGALTSDFGFYGQAVWLIGHGHLDPWSSFLGSAFLHNNAELIIWPLGLLGAPFGGNPFVLLVVQDLALALEGLVALVWISEILEQHTDLKPNARHWLWLLALAAVAFDPWCFQTAMFDFHPASFSSLFILLASRELWRGGRWPYFVWAFLLATIGTSGVLAAIGLGISALISARPRRLFGVAVIAASTIWVEVLIAHVLIGQGSEIVTKGNGFSYLVPFNHHPGISDLLVGMMMHLPAVVQVVAPKLITAVVFLLPVGMIGFLHRLAIGPVLAVFGPVMLAQSTLLFRLPAAFQIWPVLLLVLVGSVDLLARKTRLQRFEGSSKMVRRYPSKGWVAGCTTAWATCLTVVSTSVLSTLASSWLAVTPAAAASIASIAARVPPDAEVICSQGIVGRFTSRDQLFTVMTARERFPITARTVYFVLAPNQGVIQVDPSATQAMIVWVRDLPDSHVLNSAAGVTVVAWNPPAGTSAVVLSGR
ncbi:MAG TPA: DUF2079 domain-containing protein [Acidimicrobiales bacterium]|nr:DUF2079 domain-containing protein [Acidimicrobiales bacterium]